MSTLTKLFVVLLVILSLALSAATVTFVSTVTDYKAQFDAGALHVTALKGAVSNAESALAATQNELNQVQGTLNAQVSSLQQALANARKDVGEAAVSTAKLEGDLASAQANSTALTQALQASQATTSTLQTQVADLRNMSDQTAKQMTELSMALNETINKLESTERNRQFIAEQLTEAQASGNRLGAILRDNGLDADVASFGTGGGAPDIRGVIRNTGEVASVPYGVISVGSEDDVKKGMQFNVLSNDGSFLGVLKVDTVEPNEAVGTLTGPRIQEAGPGALVRTQLN